MIALISFCISAYATIPNPNSSKTKYCFYINNENILSLDNYIEFNDRLNKLYSDYKCKCKLNIHNINYDLLEDYYKYIIDYYSNESKMLDIFKDSKLDISDNELILYVDNEILIPPVSM